MIYCNYCGKESKGGILYSNGIYQICNECKTKEENLTKHNSRKNQSADKISLCPHCNCMTKNLCGKCNNIKAG